MLQLYDNVWYLLLFKAQMEILTRKWAGQRELDSCNSTLSSLCTDTGRNERCESKHMKNDLKCHLFTYEKIQPFLSPSSVISCNFKSISCLTMDCFEHAVFFSFFCLIIGLLHLLILVTTDTNDIFLEVWSRFSSLIIRYVFLQHVTENVYFLAICSRLSSTLLNLARKWELVFPLSWGCFSKLKDFHWSPWSHFRVKQCLTWPC